MAESNFSLSLLLLGGIIILTTLVRFRLKYAAVPPLVGFLILGFLVRLASSHWEFLSTEISKGVDFVATIGIILLLFRVGLESNLPGLIRQLKPASFIWAANILFSGILGYITSYFLLGLDLIPSLFIGVALTATSVAISVGIWQDAKALESPIGELLVDVAEMDDISGIILMALLFTVIPHLKGGVEASLAPIIGKTLGIFSLKLVGLGALCVLFSRYVEQHIAGFLKKRETISGQTLTLMSFGFIIAALAGLLGFSVAIGAFFAGLVFSRDPQTVKLDAPFEIVYDLFTPFFFLNIGLGIDPGTLTTALGLGATLLAVAILGKVIGNAGPTLIKTNWRDSVLLGVSMIPRAEIAMVIMHMGLQLGDWAVPTQVFSAMVLVCLATAIISPVILRMLLRRWPQTQNKNL